MTGQPSVYLSLPTLSWRGGSGSREGAGSGGCGFVSTQGEPRTVEGLQAGRVYDAKIKLKWPETVWPQRTGLSHTCFLLKGMYEFVQEADGDD
jgi:hypothetical protein